MKLLKLLLLLLCFSSTEPQENTPSSATDLTPEPTRVSLKNVAYAIEGFIIWTGNLLIVLAVATNKALRRKELIIIAGLAFSEFLYGVGYFTGGIRRGWLELTGYHDQPSTPWHCMWVVHNPFFCLAASFEPVMLIMTSVDRLLAIKAPLWYWKQRNKYAYTCLSLAGGFTAVYVMTCITGAYLKATHSEVTLSCNLFMAMPEWMGTLMFVLQALGGWGSVFIFGLVVYFYWKQGQTLPSEQLQQEHMKRQRRMTRTIGICVLITVISVCLVGIVTAILSTLQGTLIDRETFYASISVAGVVMAVNMMTNVFVFSWRQREIRAAIVRILTCGQVKLSTEKATKTRTSAKAQRNIRVAFQEQAA